MYTDASNHKDTKIFPTLVRYFHCEKGVRVKILDIVDLPGETAEIITCNLMRVIEQHSLMNTLSSYCADNTNTNFGGANRQGRENVFFKLKENVNKNIVGVGCAAHIVHKIYSHFYIYTVRTAELKIFCDEVEVMYKKMLGYYKTRWLALLPAVERVLRMFCPFYRRKNVQ